MQTFRMGIVLTMILASVAGVGEVNFRASKVLEPTASGGTQLIGQIVAIPGGAAEVVSVPSGTKLLMNFYRFDTRMNVVAQKTHSLEALSYYGPALCWDGQRFLVVASTLTRSLYQFLDINGEALTQPAELPDIPYGGRTAAFKAVWTGTHYAIFGLWLEKAVPYQDLAYGNFYTHLNYWLMDATGNFVAHKELAMLAPMTYPGIEGAEKAYFDVAWTGRHFFLAYYCESETGPPLGGYYKLYDLQGNLVAGERPIFANQVTQGARIAWNGRTIAATGLKSITIPNPNPGNFMYLRTFRPDGTPIGVESEYGQILGFGPTVFAAADRFVTAYVVLYDWDNLGYGLMLNEFDQNGQRLGLEYAAADQNGIPLLGRMVLGFDLQLTSGPDLIYGMGQTGDAYLITTQPLSFSLRYHPPGGPRLTWTQPANDWLLQWPDDAGGFQLQQAADPNGDWAPHVSEPVQADGFSRLAVPIAGNQFYRLARP